MRLMNGSTHRPSTRSAASERLTAILTSLKDAAGRRIIRGVAVAAHESEVHVELRDGSIKNTLDHLVGVGCSYARPIKAQLAADRQAQLPALKAVRRLPVPAVGGGAAGEVAGSSPPIIQ